MTILSFRATMSAAQTRYPPLSELLGKGASDSDITGLVKIDNSARPIRSGGFCDIYIGYHDTKGKVALKRPRVDPRDYNEGTLKVVVLLRSYWPSHLNRDQEIRQEIDMCRRLQSHPHILNFIGTCFIDKHLHLVTPYVAKGNLMQYIKICPTLDRVEIVSRGVESLSVCA